MSDIACSGCGLTMDESRRIAGENIEIERLRQREDDLTSILQLIRSIEYMVGIAERGSGDKIPADMTPETFVLGYVKRMEADLAELRKAQGEPVATLQVFMTSHDMGNSLAPNPPFKVAIATAFQRAKEYPLGDYELYTSAPTIPEQLFDGFSVYQTLSDQTKKRTSPENVSDVLDAVVRLIRAPKETP